MRKLNELRLGSLTVLSSHPVLDQFARDLVAGLRIENIPKGKVTVYVGLHRKFGIHIFRSGKRLAIQTEQYFDADGKKMWRRMKRWRTLKAALVNHRILELSPANKPHYDFLPTFLRRRVDFGPYIFPCSKPDFRPGDNDAFLFFGEINGRRRALLSDRLGVPVEIAPHGTFGEDLQKIVAQAAGILNLHYVDGRYSEMPRLLSACLAGKAVMSEPLGDEVFLGRDYIGLGQFPTVDDARSVYDSFWQNFAANYRFSCFLRSIMK